MLNIESISTETMSVFPDKTPIGMCYVPFQQWETPFAENVALEKGTIFPSLDLPFLGKEGNSNGSKQFNAGCSDV